MLLAIRQELLAPADYETVEFDQLLAEKTRRSRLTGAAPCLPGCGAPFPPAVRLEHTQLSRGDTRCGSGSSGASLPSP